MTNKALLICQCSNFSPKEEDFLSAVYHFSFDSLCVFNLQAKEPFSCFSECFSPGSFIPACTAHICTYKHRLTHTRTHKCTHPSEILDLGRLFFFCVTPNLFNQSSTAPAVQHEVFPNYLNVICSLLLAATLLITV